MRPFRPALAAVTAVTVLAVGLAGCGSGSSGGGGGTSPTSNSSAPADPTKATADITTTWTTFFHTGTDPQAAALLLQNGAQLGRAIKVAAKIQKQTKVKEDARVNKVVFSSPTAATVT